MLGFNDWLNIQLEKHESPMNQDPQSESCASPQAAVVAEEDPVKEDTVMPATVDNSEESSSEKDESRPYTRALRNYPTLAPPTGGGPNFMYIATDAQASAKAGGRNVSPEPFPGQSDQEIKANVKKWKALSGIGTYKSGSSKKS